MTTKPRVVIIEDKEEDLDEVLDCLGETGFCQADIIAQPSTYEDSLATLDKRASDIDLVLLDLNLPRDDDDSRPEKGHGRRLLDHIQNLNRRPHVHIRVIVVSAETLDDSWDKQPLLTQYAGTLLGFAQKAELAQSLKESLDLFGQDPLRDWILHVDLGVEQHYDKIIDPTVPIRERLEEACALVTRLLRNDLDYTYKNPRASAEFSDNLNGLIWKIKQERFSASSDGKHHICASRIQSPGGWQAFLWRGCLEQHLYTLLRYRNDYVHIRAKPFRSENGAKDGWEIPHDLLVSMERGEVLGQVIELIVRDLLDWYLPWHEQVYLPWREAKTAGGAKS